jgi:hypothetical protein
MPDGVYAELIAGEGKMRRVVSNSQRRLVGATTRHSSILIVHGKRHRKPFLGCSSIPRFAGVASSYACFVDDKRKRKEDPRSRSWQKLQLRDESFSSTLSFKAVLQAIDYPTAICYFFDPKVTHGIYGMSLERGFGSVSLEMQMRARSYYD